MELLKIMLWILAFTANGKGEVEKTFTAISEIYIRFATTNVLIAVENKGSKTEEIVLEVTIPERAFISNLTVTTNGRTTLGNVLAKADAERKYEKAKTLSTLVSERQKQSARVFEMKINVLGRQKAALKLTYQELLERRNSRYRHFVSVPHQKDGYKKASVDIVLSDRNRIKDVHIPAVTPQLQQKATNDLLSISHQEEMVKNLVYRAGTALGYIKYDRRSESGGDMVVLFDVEPTEDGGDIFVSEGHFVHFIIPDTDKERLRGTGAYIDHNVVFVLDKSGSMNNIINRGNQSKFDQLEDGLQEMLKELKDQDKLSVVMFSSNVAVWRNELQNATRANKDDIVNQFFRNARKGGGTNIGLGLTEAFKIFDRNPPLMCAVFFLTDGRATLGQTNKNLLLQMVKDANKQDCYLYTIAFGAEKDVDPILLKKLADENFGVYRLIYPDSDADFQLKGFFNEFAHVVMKAVDVHYVDGSVELKSLVKTMRDLTEGGEAKAVGKLTSDQAYMNGFVQGKDKRGNIVQLPVAVHPGKLPCQQPLEGMSKELVDQEIENGLFCAASSARGSSGDGTRVAGLIERAYAYQTVNRLLEDFHSKEDTKARDRALDMALKARF